jgi:hypothetical protein
MLETPCLQLRHGVNIMATTFGDFRHFWRRIEIFLLKKNVRIIFSA